MGIISDIYRKKEIMKSMRSKYDLSKLVEILNKNLTDEISSITLLEDEYIICIKLKEGFIRLLPNNFDNYKIFDKYIREWLGDDLIVEPYFLYDICRLSETECLLEF